MTWHRSLIVLVVVTSIAALVVDSIITGRDAPVTLAGLLGTALGLAFGADAFTRRKE